MGCTACEMWLTILCEVLAQMPRNLKVIKLIHCFFFFFFPSLLVNFPKVYVHYKAMMKVSPLPLSRTDTIYKKKGVDLRSRPARYILRPKAISLIKNNL